MNDTATAMLDAFISPNELDANGEAANVVDAVCRVARSIRVLAKAVDGLGNGDAATPMGALEALTVQLCASLDRIAGAIEASGR